jgi:hypothetical protein
MQNNMNKLTVGGAARYIRGKQSNDGDAAVSDIVRIQRLFKPSFARVHDIKIRTATDSQGQAYRKFAENPVAYEDLPVACLTPLEWL